ncbi:hypothetical protein [Ancylobacter sp.]|uniref:hypothetical protein n=1 Tax=Ancylobacter sp. TaxID=1872567 RepID=UPI003BACEDEF
MSDTQNTPWYPPGEGWVEWHGGPNPVPGAEVEILLRSERETLTYEPEVMRSVVAEPWEHEGFGEDTVAYRVVTPYPTAVDRALLDEMVKALVACEKQAEEARMILINHLEEPERQAFWKAVNIRGLARAALAKAREASK